MKKKKFKPNLPGHPESSDDKTSRNTSFNSANEDLYNKFVEEERIDHKDISVTKTWDETGSNDGTKKFNIEELVRK